MVVGWEDEIQLFLKQYNSNFVTYEILPGNNTIKNFSEAVYTMGDHEKTLQIEYNDISMKTIFVLTRSGGTFGTFILDKNSFFNTLLGFKPHWNFTPLNAFHDDSPGVYTS